MVQMRKLKIQYNYVIRKLIERFNVLYMLHYAYAAMQKLAKSLAKTAL